MTRSPVTTVAARVYGDGLRNVNMHGTFSASPTNTTAILRTSGTLPSAIPKGTSLAVSTITIHNIHQNTIFQLRNT
jgi:hypothetical protein